MESLGESNSPQRESLASSVTAAFRRERLEAERDRTLAEATARARQGRAAASAGQMRRLGRLLLALADDAEAGQPVGVKMYDIEVSLAVLRQSAVLQ